MVPPSLLLKENVASGSLEKTVLSKFKSYIPRVILYPIHLRYANVGCLAVPRGGDGAGTVGQHLERVRAGR